MFWVLGFIPGWIVAKILAAFDMLRIPKEIEIAGLDLAQNTLVTAELAEVEAAEKSEA